MEYELSYLIRMGAGKHPQCFGTYARDVIGKSTEDLAAVNSTCVVGAATVALIAITALEFHSAKVVIESVVKSAGLKSLHNLNDAGRLTREEIADRLDALPGGSPMVRVP